MRFHLAPRLLTLTADLFRFLVQRLERSGTLSSFESCNGFAQALDELAVVLKKHVTFVADHEGANRIAPPSQAP